MTAATYAAANIDERDVCPELTGKIQGLLLGDKGFIRPELKMALLEQGVNLETPSRSNMQARSNMQDERSKSFLRWMMGRGRDVNHW